MTDSRKEGGVSPYTEALHVRLGMQAIFFIDPLTNMDTNERWVLGVKDVWPQTLLLWLPLFLFISVCSGGSHTVAFQ